MVERPKYIGEEAARKDLGTSRSKPAWLQKQHSLPFQFLSDDEFEIFCYLLLRREYPEENISYYGKTGDAGRDIVRIKKDGVVELIQCKRYDRNVTINKIRSEIAKLYFNLHNQIILDRPDSVIFYVVPDLTASAQDLINHHSKWSEMAELALREFLKKQPTKELLDFALSWYPNFSKQTAIDLTERVRKYEDLVEEFFAYKKVIDSDDPKLNAILENQEIFKSQLDEFTKLLKQASETPRMLLQPEIASPFADLELFSKLEQLEKDNPGLGFTVQISSQETVINIGPKQSTGSGIYGTLSFSDTTAGKQGQQKFKIFEQEGRAIRLEPGEYEWTWTPTISLPPIQDALEIYPVVSQREVPVSLECLQDGELVASVDFAYLHLMRFGTHEIEFFVKGGHFLGQITMIKNFLKNSLIFNFAANLGCVTAERARRTIALLLALLRGGKLQIKSLEFDAPLIIGSTVTNSDLWKEKLEDYISFLDSLIKINREFNVDIRYPKIVEPDTEKAINVIASVIENGQIESPGGNITLPYSQRDALQIVKLLHTGEPFDLIMDGERKYQILGQYLPMGKTKMVFQNTFPSIGLASLEKAVQKLSDKDNIHIEMRYDKAIEIFLRWLPEAADEQTETA